MPRVFERQIDVPDVDLLDWTLIERVVALFQQYATPSCRFVLRGEDSRGAYFETDLETFRQYVEQQDETPQRISITLESGGDDNEEDHYRNFIVWWSEERFRRGVSLTSSDEAVVDHVRARLEDLLSRAHERRRERIAKEESEAEPRSPQQPNVVSPAPRTPEVLTMSESSVRRFLYNPYTVTVVGGLVLAAITAIVLWRF